VSAYPLSHTVSDGVTVAATPFPNPPISAFQEQKLMLGKFTCSELLNDGDLTLKSRLFTALFMNAFVLLTACYEQQKSTRPQSNTVDYSIVLIAFS
jgi:hypothetical protein